jgi:hypothetical protein
MKKKIERTEIDTKIWIPEASYFGNLLESNEIKYAIFGAGALAVQNIMVRPTIDIDFVVDDYGKAISVMREQPNLDSSNLKKERDGIQVADFYFKSGITIQIWDNNMYSLPMTKESWAHIAFKPVGGYRSIWSISREDLIVSKVGRYTQQIRWNEYEANKNVRDIVATIQTLTKPDFKYVVQRLAEGARKETLEKYSKIHNLNWYFVREAGIYQKMAEPLDGEKIRKFVASVLTQSKSANMEYWMLHSLRKGKSISKFKTDFMLDKKNYLELQQRWNSILKINGDKVTINAKDIQQYVESLKPETLSDYAKKLIFSGKEKS